MTSDDKKIWREKWLRCINELTSLELQKKSWFDRTQKNPHWSFVEFICSYFADLGIDDHYKYPIDKGWLTNHEFEIIKDWHEALDKYNSPDNNDNDHAAILTDPKWLDILQRGQEVKRKLAAILNETENEVLTEEINYPDFRQN